jgi:hypothetical protein
MSEVDSKLDFSTLEFVSDNGRKTTTIGGIEWEQWFWDIPFMRCLRARVQAGIAQIKDNKEYFFVEISKELVRCEINMWIKQSTLAEAVEFTKNYSWEVKEHAELDWHKTRDDDDLITYRAVIGDGDLVEVDYWKRDNRFSVARKIRPNGNEFFELKADRSGEFAITSFAEAAAIAITLPQFLAVLGARQ